MGLKISNFIEKKVARTVDYDIVEKVIVVEL